MEKLVECEANLAVARSRLIQAKRRRREAEKHFQFRDLQLREAHANYEWYWKLDYAARLSVANAGGGGERVVHDRSPSDDICLSAADSCGDGAAGAGAEGRCEGPVQEAAEPQGSAAQTLGAHGGGGAPTESQCESHDTDRATQITTSAPPTAVGTYIVAIVDGDSPDYPSCSPGRSWCGRV